MTDGLVLGVTVCKPGDDPVVVEHPLGTVAPLVPLSSAEFHALFEGPKVDRFARVADLPDATFCALWGRSNDRKRKDPPDSPLGRTTGEAYRRIGRALRAPWVRERLRDAPIDVLEAAARESEPDAQVLAAARVQAKKAARLRGRRRAAR